MINIQIFPKGIRTKMNEKCNKSSNLLPVPHVSHNAIKTNDTLSSAADEDRVSHVLSHVV